MINLDSLWHRLRRERPQLPELPTIGQHHPQVKVNVLVCDSQYGNGIFMEQASQLIGHKKAISQLRHNQPE